MHFHLWRDEAAGGKFANLLEGAVGLREESVSQGKSTTNKAKCSKMLNLGSMDKMCKSKGGSKTALLPPKEKKKTTNHSQA